jgi:hypothetical protein
MPGIRLFGRRFNFSSDDLTIPSLIDMIFRFPLLIIFIIFRRQDQSFHSKCPSFYINYFYPLLIVFAMITFVSFLICIISLQGTPVNNIRPRRHMPLLIYIRLFLVLIDIGINIFGLIRIFQICEVRLREILITSIVISCITAIILFVILAIFIDLTGIISSEKKWQMRIKFLFCCNRDYGKRKIRLNVCTTNLNNVGGQSSDRENIVRILQYLFDDERFDLVGSDVAAGLILLQQEDLFEEHSIDIIENVPLEILKEGFYYNSYAQSAFGW